MTLLPPSICSDTLSGHRSPLSGSVKDLFVQATGFASAEAEFTPDIENPNEHELGLYVDGSLTARMPAESLRAGIAGLTEGDHTVAIRCNGVGDTFPDYHGDNQGQRAYLKWPRSTDGSCTAYKVYQGGALIATVDEVQIQEGINVRGGEPGRITYYGGYSGEASVNDTITLTLADTGQWEYTCAAGTAEGTFSPGQSLALPYGVWAEILDDLEAYGTLSTYEIAVGPVPFYLTDPLTPGDYVFTVSAVDAAGNESTALPARTVRIYEIPSELPGVYQEWNVATQTMTIGWSAAAAASAGIETVNIYANHSDVRGRLTDFIIEDMPWKTVSAATGLVTLARTDTTDGEVRMYLRPVNAAGRERRSLRMVRFNMPAQPIDQGLTLGAPTNLVVTPRAAGSLLVSVDYAWDEENDSLTGLEVAIADTEGGQVFTGTPNINTDVADGFPVSTYTLTLPGPYTGTQYVVVRAYAGVGASRDSEEVSGVADATAPVFAGELRGVAQ